MGYGVLVESIQAIVWRGDARTFQFNFVSHEAETPGVSRGALDDRADVLARSRTLTIATGQPTFVASRPICSGRMRWSTG